MDGSALIETLVAASGLPENSLKAEIQRLLNESRTSPDAVTLEMFREILENYLREVLVEAKNAQP